MGDRVFCGWAIGFFVDGRSDFVDGRSDFWMGDRVFRVDGRSNLKSSAVEIPAVGNRVYTNDVRLRGRRGYSEIENHRVKSSTREGGFCLCSRGFNRRGFWVSTAGFFVDGRSHFWIDGRSGFLLIGRSGFLWMGDRVFGFMCDRTFGLMGDRAFGGWAIGL